MKKEKNNKKKIISIIISLFILILLLTIILGYFYLTDSTTIKKRKLEYINGEEWNSEIFPEDLPKLFRSYGGELTARNIGKSIYYVVTEAIPEYYAQLKSVSNDGDIENYFNENKKIIGIDFGITEKVQFVNLIKEITKLDIQNFEIEEFYIDKDSIKNHLSTAEADLHIKYKGTEDEIVLKILLNGTIEKNVSTIKYYK